MSTGLIRDEELGIDRSALADDIAKHIDDSLTEEPEEFENTTNNEALNTENLIPTGSTTLNLLLSDNPYGGYGKGKMVHMVGDSSSGKTMLALTCFAEVLKTPRLQNYSLYFDEPESALSMDVEKLFGKSLLPKVDRKRSDTVQDFYVNIYKACQKGNPFGYILDSFDALTSREEQKRAEKAAKAAVRKSREGTDTDENGDEKEKKEKGSYKMEKPKLAHEIFRVICRDLARCGSFLIVISQSKQKIDVTFGAKKTWSGGDALKFYATHQFFLAVENHDYVTANKIKIPIGINAIARCTKNKLTGKEYRSCYFPIFYDYGLDDIGSCIDFMIDSGEWKKTTNTIEDPWSICESKRALIDFIEKNNQEELLQLMVYNAYKKIEDSLKLNRKPRF